MRRSGFSKTLSTVVLGALIAFVPLAGPGLSGMQTNGLRQGLPGRRISGGSRSPAASCLRTPDQAVVALMPKSNLGLTLADRPTLWFLLPAVSPDKQLELGLFDSKGDLVYQKTIQAPDSAGLTGFSLPDTIAPLTPGENYRWYLSVVCNPGSRAEDLYVTGWTSRVSPDSTLLQALSTASVQERLAIYESSSLWLDTLTALAELQQQDYAAAEPAEPGNVQIAQQLSHFIETADLEQFSGAILASQLQLLPL